ncbi:sulfotransferase family protein [Rhodanobacter sp. C01]|uniref:tetratricopeptide repeat-containing sulfotransferase family protein n=1 Tax=Rhodanobacter sp. C01 TaxID=1945856 RepID=UPI0020C500D4|nr:sulfotransferase family protein [Rhodanobacter sp. C01]
MTITSAPTPDASERHLVAYERQRAQGRMQAARRELLEALAGVPELEWLACARALVLRSDTEAAHAVLSAALITHPGSIDLRFALAGILQQRGESAEAETMLHELLVRQPAHAAATFLLTSLLSQQGRTHTAAVVMRSLFARARQDVDTVIRAVEMLDDMQRTADAAAICEAEIAAGTSDPRIHAYAGMLGIQLGQFERVRERYAFALTHSQQAVEWNIPIGLSSLQRYEDDSHPDFELFRDVLQQPGLGEKARITTLFALGKAHDDIADHAQAADYLRQANALAHAHSTWSRKRWRRLVEARLAARPLPFRLTAPDEWTPLFIVGVPRSGTTLLAELLARHPLVCNRGELGWLATVARRLEQAGAREPAAFEQAASTYAAQLRQDDSDAHWFIDKQPLNLLHIDLILALWPNARIIHCRRNPRDTALSLWSQSFHDPAHDYAYDFGDIAALIQGCERMHAHALARHAASIHTVLYEELIADPGSCLDGLARWLGLPGHDLLATPSPDHAISTASAWQARQPIHAHSVARWRSYAPHVPELLRFPDK